ncbi:MAG TPA: DUF4440 domain-containing protein [Pyrinomonadaceae bacterium]|nr:DUF4440 domain-containing protein [Pyrinomonadaceae bacterium]
MKKLLVLLCALVITAACSMPSTTNTSKPADSPAVKADTLSDADLIAKEKEAWTTLEQKDLAAFGNLLDADYVEVGETAVFDKAGVLEFVKDLELSTPAFSDWKVIPAGKEVMLVTYTVTVKSTYKGQPAPDGPYRASGAWVKRNDKWLSVYFQETLVDTKPALTQSTDAPAQSSELPARTLAEASDDGVANEKMIWDALKHKDYQAFASYLDEAQIEVTANGVNDKPASVKGVHAVDFSKFQQSDFKAQSLSPEVMLVTYLVKLPDPKAPLSRATTMWLKREGKWRALFHQETPQERVASAVTPKKTS